MEQKSSPLMTDADTTSYPAEYLEREVEFLEYAAGELARQGLLYEVIKEGEVDPRTGRVYVKIECSPVMMQFVGNAPILTVLQAGINAASEDPLIAMEEEARKQGSLHYTDAQGILHLRRG